MNYLTVYKNHAQNLAQKLQNKYITCDTKIVRKKRNRFENITNDLPIGKIDIEAYSAKTIFEFEKMKMIISFEGRFRTLSLSVIFENSSHGSNAEFFDVFNLFRVKEFRNPNSAYLYNHEKLDIAFNWLSGIVLDRIDEICIIAKDMELIKILDENVNNDVKLLCKRTKAQHNILENACRNFECNNYDKAIEKFESQKALLTLYEANLLQFMKAQKQAGQEKSFTAIPNEINISRIYMEAGNKALLTMLMGLIGLPLFCITTSAVCMGLFLILQKIVGNLAVLPPLEFFLLPGIFGGLSLYGVFHEPLLTRIQKLKCKDYFNIENINSSKGERLFVKLFFVTVLAFCIMLTLHGLCWSAVFNNDYIIDNSSFLSLAAKNISYNEVEGFYKVSAFKNDEGNIHNSPSFAIKLKNGEIIDFRPLNSMNEETIEFLETKIGALQFTQFIQDIKE